MINTAAARFIISEAKRQIVCIPLGPLPSNACHHAEAERHAYLFSWLTADINIALCLLICILLNRPPAEKQRFVSLLSGSPAVLVAALRFCAHSTPNCFYFSHISPPAEAQ